MVNKPVLIAFLGKIGSGKTTGAKFVVSRYGACIKTIATPIKKMAKDIWGFSNNQLYGKDKLVIDPVHNITARWALQHLGASARKVLGENFWIDLLIDDLKQHAKRADDYFLGTKLIFVIDDLRYPNEVIRLKQLNKEFQVYVIKLINTVNINDPSNHESEVLQDMVDNKYIDFEIISGTEQDLYNQITSIFDTIFV